MNTTKKLIVLSLLLALAGFTGSARAGQENTPAPTPPAPTAPTTPETPAPTTPAPTTPAPETPAVKTTKPVEQQLNGRIVALDKAAKTITLQVNAQTYVLQTAPDTKFNQGGKTKTLEDLLVGDEVGVTVALRETASGRVEIAVVSVDLPNGTEAQGGRQGTGPVSLPPFVNLPNQANVGGHIRSPSN